VWHAETSERLQAIILLQEHFRLDACLLEDGGTRP